MNGRFPAPQMLPSSVVAVLDGGFNPYHFDFLSAHMPQHLDDDPSNDLPLDTDPASWLPGHPGAAAFASHGPLALSLTPDNGKAVPADLFEKDAKAWDSVEQSDPTGEVHMRWIPGTKVVGFVDFGGDGGFATASHGVGTTGVSVGNLHGTCPECLLLFVNLQGASEAAMEQAIEWAMDQPWIDVITNSYGAGSVVQADIAWTYHTPLPAVAAIAL